MRALLLTFLVVGLFIAPYLTLTIVLLYALFRFLDFIPWWVWALVIGLLLLDLYD